VTGRRSPLLESLWGSCVPGKGYDRVRNKRGTSRIAGYRMSSLSGAAAAGGRCGMGSRASPILLLIETRMLTLRTGHLLPEVAVKLLVLPFESLVLCREFRNFEGKEARFHLFRLKLVAHFVHCALLAHAESLLSSAILFTATLTSVLVKWSRGRNYAVMMLLKNSLGSSYRVLTFGTSTTVEGEHFVLCLVTIKFTGRRG
jgi:hypothetical protein